MLAGQTLSLFVGHPQVLLRYRAALPGVRLHALTQNASLAVLSLDPDLHDALHHAYGTGEWAESGVGLTSTDFAFAARVSEAGALAFIEIADGDGEQHQHAVAWNGGDVVLKPASLAAKVAGNRPRATWPINAALRSLGLRAAPGLDEYETFGLGAYDTHESILSRALPTRV